jgi:dTDP-4-dehydrorhamnose reductase
MKILITGANGYIGSALKKALSTCDVYTPTSVFVNFTRSEDVDSYFKTHKYFNIVIHCAIRGGSRLRIDDWSVMDDNLKMYYNLLNNKDKIGKFINIGSGAELFDFLKPYGMSKRVISDSMYCKDDFYNIRVFGVFDENELDTRFIKSNIKRYINREPMEIYADKYMDFFYMQDLIKVIEYYIKEKTPPKEFDCVYSDATWSLFGLTTIINDLDNYKVEIIYDDKIVDDYTSKSRSKLPIKFIGLREGIKRTYKKLVNETNIILN